MIPLIPLSHAGIAAGLTGTHAGICVRLYDSIDSTNTEARRLMDFVLKTASGQKVCAERHGFHDLAIFKTGVTL